MGVNPRVVGLSVKWHGSGFWLCERVTAHSQGNKRMSRLFSITPDSAPLSLLGNKRGTNPNFRIADNPTAIARCLPKIRRPAARQGDQPSFEIMSHATAALAREKPAQINMTILNPNTNASPIDSLMAAFVLGLRPAGTSKPASLISSA